MMKYKNYLGEVTYDSEAKLFHGEVIGINNVITFQGTTVEEIEKAFKDSVNDYISWCQERGEKPEESYTGNLRIRIPSELHSKLDQLAKMQGVSLNALIIDRLQKNS